METMHKVSSELPGTKEVVQEYSESGRNGKRAVVGTAGLLLLLSFSIST